MKRLARIFTLLGMALAMALPVQAAQPIRIGALYNLTGGMSSIDAPSFNGARLRVKMINQAGGLLGRKLVLIGMDTKTNQRASAMGAKKVLGEGIVAGIGYSDPAYVLPAAPLFQKRGIPFLTSGATLPTLPAMIGNCMFLTPYGDNIQAFAVADFATRRLRAKRIAVWTDNSMDFTKTLAKFFKQRAQRDGASIVLQDFFMNGDKDFSAQIARLKATRADAVFVSAGPDEAGILVKQIREAGIRMPILSGDGFDTELVVTVPGRRLAYGVYFSTHTFRGEKRPEVLKFIKAYKKEYHRAPENAFAALGYDSVGLIADAITRARSTNPAAIRRALAVTRNYRAVTGSITFAGTNGVPMKNVSIIGVNGGRYTVENVWNPNGK